jgi:hypothetical protein
LMTIYASGFLDTHLNLINEVNEIILFLFDFLIFLNLIKFKIKVYFSTFYICNPSVDLMNCCPVDFN